MLRPSASNMDDLFKMSSQHRFPNWIASRTDRNGSRLRTGEIAAARERPRDLVSFLVQRIYHYILPWSITCFAAGVLYRLYSYQQRSRKHMQAALNINL